MRSHGWKVLVGLTVAAALVAGGWWAYEDAEARSLTDGIVEASGRIEVERIHVAPAVGGRVLRVAVSEGDRVEAGDLVAEIDDRAAAAALREAEAAVEVAEANRETAGRRLEAVRSEAGLARTEARRYRELFARDAVARQVVDRAEATLERLEAEVRGAEAALEAADRQAKAARARREAVQVRLSETRIVAPAPGVVDREVVRAGEMGAPGRPVVVLLRKGSAELRVYLPLRTAQSVRPGTEARVYVDAFPGRVFQGRVERVSGDAEFTPRDVHMPDERTTLVYAADIRVADPDGTLKDGFPADAWLRTDPSVPWPQGPPW